MPRKARDVERLLVRKFGFSRAENQSADHVWYLLKLDEHTIKTKFSHGAGTLSKKLEGMIARQLRVRKAYFDGMFDCTNSSEDYRRQVEEDPDPDWSVRF